MRDTGDGADEITTEGGDGITDSPSTSEEKRDDEGTTVVLFDKEIEGGDSAATPSIGTETGKTPFPAIDAVDLYCGGIGFRECTG